MKVPDVPLYVFTHKRQVLNLYRRALRNLHSVYDSFNGDRLYLRYASVVLRERFDRNRSVAEAHGRKLLAEGEAELASKAHFSQIKFADSYGGLLWHRDSVIPDWVVDFWHPLEKAQYPEYFARRETRKKEFVKMWEKTYGKIEHDDHH